MKTTTNYQQMTLDILNPMGVKMIVKFLKYDRYFSDDKEARNIYRITFKREGAEFSLRFGQSIFASHEGTLPTEYDVLACIQKNDVGSFENFCDDFGYNVDSINQHKIYIAICKEWEKVSNFFSSEELEAIQEIN